MGSPSAVTSLACLSRHRDIFSRDSFRIEVESQDTRVVTEDGWNFPVWPKITVTCMSDPLCVCAYTCEYVHMCICVCMHRCM